MAATAPKKILLAIACLAVIAASGSWIYFRNFAGPDINLKPHISLGRVMAEETIRLLEKKQKKRIVIVALDSADPAARAQLEAFEEIIAKNKAIEVKEKYLLEPDGKHRHGPGFGLSARRFVRIVDSNKKAEAIVSFVGTPDPDDEHMKNLDPPRFIAATREDLDQVGKLLDTKILRVAIVPRFDFPAPVEDPKTERQWFDKYYQLVRTEKKPPAAVRRGE